MAKPLSSLTNVWFLLWNIQINVWIHTLNGLKRVVLIHYLCNSDVSTFKWQLRMLKIQRTTKSKWILHSYNKEHFSFFVCLCFGQLNQYTTLQKDLSVSATQSAKLQVCSVSTLFTVTSCVWQTWMTSAVVLPVFFEHYIYTFKSITLKCVWICQCVSRLLSLKLQVTNVTPGKVNVLSCKEMKSARVFTLILHPRGGG